MAKSPNSGSGFKDTSKEKHYYSKDNIMSKNPEDYNGFDGKNDKDVHRMLQGGARDVDIVKDNDFGCPGLPGLRGRTISDEEVERDV